MESDSPKKSHPSELWRTYFTSSKHVKEFRRINGEPDVIEIRKLFDCKEKAVLWESKVLKKMDVIHNDKWLNRTDNEAIRDGSRREYGEPWNKGLTGTKRSIESIEKQKNSITGKKRGKYNIIETEEKKDRRAELSIAMKGNKIAKGNRYSDEEKLKRSLANLGTNWWTDGIKEVKSKICPPGFRRGRIKKLLPSQQRFQKP